VNDLAQQASGFQLNREKFSFLEKLNVTVCQTGESNFSSMHSAIVYFAKPSLAKMDVPVVGTHKTPISCANMSSKCIK
jgi:hypothetical protein